MRKILITLSCIPVGICAQTNSQNWTKKTSYREPGNGRPVSSVTYYDGLGRPVQQNINKQSGTGKDLVTHMEYEMNRQLKDYLPYPAGSTDMSYQTDAKTATLGYSQYNGQFPFSEKIQEASPLARLLKQGAPGTDWQINPSADTDHSIKVTYETNINNEVKNYFATTVWDSANGIYIPQLQDKGFYSANQVYKTITKNENWTSGKDNTTEEFKDKEGRLLLKRTYNGEAYDTYYVYDLYGNLTYVIPPLAFNPVLQMDDLCYQYKYDDLNRMVEKKLPGKQWEYIVYDKLDRAVATGPALSPFGGTDTGYLITKYDGLNRVVYTGWMQSAVTRSVLQQQYKNESTKFSEGRLRPGTTENVDNVGIGYSNLVIPVSNMKLLTVNYYDDYNYPGAVTPPSTVEGQTAAVSVTGKSTGNWIRVLTSPSETLNEQSYTLYDLKYRPIRIHTVNHLNGYTRVDSKLDFSGKVLQTQTYHKLNNSAAELNVTDTFIYTEEDRLARHKQKINSGPEQLIAGNSYDELGKLISKKVGGTDVTGATGLQKIDYRYNIRGWLTDINNNALLGNPELRLEEGDLFGFKINYNNVTESENGQVVSASQSLGGEVTPLYNGNISETFWKTTSDNVLRKYGYQYDVLNRITNSFYQKPETASPYTGAYDESLRYDKNGNITSLNRNGNLDNSVFVIPIDDLKYTYTGNRLMRVNDVTNNPEGFADNGYENTNDDYAYDANGNMIKDLNKRITNIVYNHLNLPTEIVFADGNKINYMYNAAGVKLKKNVTISGAVTPTDYQQSFQYVNLKLSFFPHAEGYVKVTDEVYFNHVFNYTDHLGNIRASWAYDDKSGGLKIMEENHYYPFGLKHKAYNVQQFSFVTPSDGTPGYMTPYLADGGSKPLVNSYKYKFQGQERQDELGLNWDSFKWRNYDYAIGRFMNIDPLTEKYNTWSPYVFSGNRVIDARELEGLEPMESRNPVTKFGNWASNKFNTAVDSFNKSVQGFGKTVSDALSKLDSKVSGKPERSNKDISVSLRSKNGGGDNPTTTGAADDHWNVDGFFSAAAASGSPFPGNNFKTLTDVLSGVKDAKAGFDLGSGIIDEMQSKGTVPPEKNSTLTIVQYEKIDGGLYDRSYKRTTNLITEAQAKKDSAKLSDDRTYITINKENNVKEKK